jgi:hypothetical protein
VAQWFYEELLSNETIDADAVAYALDHAVRNLREKIPREPKRWAPYIHMGAVHPHGRRTSTWAPYIHMGA